MRGSCYHCYCLSKLSLWRASLGQWHDLLNASRAVTLSVFACVQAVERGHDSCDAGV